MIGKARPMPESLLGRMFANVAWLLGGKTFGAICSLAYLAILTRSLGLKDFGHFSLIFGASQALIAVAGFQTWRVVVRYGVGHVHKQEWDAFGRLGLMAGAIDALGAVLGTVVAYIAIYQFGDVLDINPELSDIAFWFVVAALWALVSAPTGIVRALDRFDMAVYVEALVPSGRLLGALIIWLTGPTLVKFLIVWALVDLIEAAAYWCMARYLAPGSINLRNAFQWRSTRQENPGITRFFMITYASATLEATMRHGPLLAVGYFVGTSAAGLYRLAHQLAQGLSKLTNVLTKAAYAEIARASVAANVMEFRKLAIQTTKLAGAAGAIVIGLAVAIGGHMLALLAGEEFRPAYEVLIPLTVAACFELGSVAFEPVLHSSGKARNALASRLVAVCAMLAALFLVVEKGGGPAAAWSVALGGAVHYLVMGAMAWLTLRRLARENSGEDSAQISR
ncbi:lipopolysaccharide biosynthesis protein [Altererythrobacter aquiaggeris]|uniref:lipopolysaccharide biosynthesis protein n=1 Tax=Aestuarierythrobacter aquiaggeris TaxID=1898396 RepID=UPI00301AB5B7